MWLINNQHHSEEEKKILKVKVTERKSGKVYREFNAVRVATRYGVINSSSTEIVIYANGHGYAFNIEFYEIMIEGWII